MIRVRILILAGFLCLGLMASSGIFAGEAWAAWFGEQTNTGVVKQGNADEYGGTAEGYAIVVGKGGIQGSPNDYDGLGVGADDPANWAQLLIYEGSVKVQTALNVSGATTISNSLNVTGGISGTLTTAAQGNITSLGTLTSLGVSGSSTLGDGGDTTTVNGNLVVTNGASISNGLNNNSGGITSAGTISGVTSLNIGYEATDGITSLGILKITGNTDNSPSLGSEGVVIKSQTSGGGGIVSVLGSGVTIAGGTNNTGTLTVGGAAQINSTLGVTGATITAGITNTGNIATTTLNTTGAATIGNGLTVSAGGADITGNANVSGTLNSAGNFSVGTNKFTVNAASGNTSVAGTLTANGGVYTATIGTPNSNSDLSISAGATSGSINLHAQTATTIYVNEDGTGANESFKVNVGSTTDGAAVSQVTTIQSNENSTLITNGNAILTVGGTSKANAITLNSNSNTITGLSNVIQSAASGNSRSLITANATQASVQYVDANGDNHGLSVTGTQTILSGGTRSSTWTMADGELGGATLTVAGSTSGSAVQLISATTNSTTTSSALTLGLSGASGSVNTLQGSNNIITASQNNVTGATIIDTVNAGTAAATVAQALGSRLSMTNGNANLSSSSTGSSLGLTNTTASLATANHGSLSITDNNNAILTGGNATSTSNVTLGAATITGSAAGTQLLNLSNAGSGSTTSELGTSAPDSTVNLLGGTTNIGTTVLASHNTIGHVGDSVNLITGATNQITGNAGANTTSNGITATTGNNVITSTLGSNTIQGQIGNTIDTNTGNNVINADVGANLLTGNAGANSTSNSITATTGNNAISALGTNGSNLVTSALRNTLEADGAVADANFINATAGGNTITGYTGNTITATTGSNTISAVTGANTITGQTGNIVTATTGNNAISATAGSNAISANAANQSNTLSATGSNGVNNMTANSSTGTNNIEAKTNKIGVATANSINTIGNAGSSTNTMTGATNAMTSSTSNTISTNGGGYMQTTATYVMMRGTNTDGLATNGASGTSSHIGAGAVTVNNSVQTIATGTTINNALEGKQYQTIVHGNLFVDGNTYINGTLDYVSSNSATTTVVGAGTGTSILPDASQGTSGGTNIVMKGSNGATESKAELTLTNGVGNTHGVEVYENRTVLSGGTRSSNMRLDDSGATFYNSVNNAPIKVTGVADGTADFDAVNFRQLQKANIGIASVSALSAIPATMPGKNFAIGAGYGYFEGSSAVAIGIKAAIWNNLSVAAGVGLGVGQSTNTFTTNAGFSYSF